MENFAFIDDDGDYVSDDDVKNYSLIAVFLSLTIQITFGQSQISWIEQRSKQDSMYA